MLHALTDTMMSGAGTFALIDGKIVQLCPPALDGENNTPLPQSDCNKITPSPIQSNLVSNVSPNPAIVSFTMSPSIPLGTVLSFPLVPGSCTVGVNLPGQPQVPTVEGTIKTVLSSLIQSDLKSKIKAKLISSNQSNLTNIQKAPVCHQNVVQPSIHSIMSPIVQPSMPNLMPTIPNIEPNIQEGIQQNLAVAPQSVSMVVQNFPPILTQIPSIVNQGTINIVNQNPSTQVMPTTQQQLVSLETFMSAQTAERQTSSPPGPVISNVQSLSKPHISGKQFIYNSGNDCIGVMETFNPKPQLCPIGAKMPIRRWRTPTPPIRRNPVRIEPKGISNQNKLKHSDLELMTKDKKSNSTPVPQTLFKRVTKTSGEPAVICINLQEKQMNLVELRHVEDNNILNKEITDVSQFNIRKPSTHETKTTLHKHQLAQPELSQSCQTVSHHPVTIPPSHVVSNLCVVSAKTNTSRPDKATSTSLSVLPHFDKFKHTGSPSSQALQHFGIQKFGNQTKNHTVSSQSAQRLNTVSFWQDDKGTKLPNYWGGPNKVIHVTTPSTSTSVPYSTVLQKGVDQTNQNFITPSSVVQLPTKSKIIQDCINPLIQVTEGNKSILTSFLSEGQYILCSSSDTQISAASTSGKTIINPLSAFVKPLPVVNQPLTCVKSSLAAVNQPSALVDQSTLGNPSLILVNPSSPIVKQSSTPVNPSTLVCPSSAIVNQPSALVDQSTLGNLSLILVNPSSPIVKQSSTHVNPSSTRVNPSSTCVNPSSTIVDPSTLVCPSSAVVNQSLTCINPLSTLVKMPSNHASRSSSHVIQLSDNQRSQQGTQVGQIIIKPVSSNQNCMSVEVAMKGTFNNSLSTGMTFGANKVISCNAESSTLASNSKALENISGVSHQKKRTVVDSHVTDIYPKVQMKSRKKEAQFGVLLESPPVEANFQKVTSSKVPVVIPCAKFSSDSLLKGPFMTTNKIPFTVSSFVPVQMSQKRNDVIDLTQETAKFSEMNTRVSATVISGNKGFIENDSSNKQKDKMCSTSGFNCGTKSAIEIFVDLTAEEENLREVEKEKNKFLSISSQSPPKIAGKLEVNVESSYRQLQEESGTPKRYIEVDLSGSSSPDQSSVFIGIQSNDQTETESSADTQFEGISKTSLFVDLIDGSGIDAERVENVTKHLDKSSDRMDSGENCLMSDFDYSTSSSTINLAQYYLPQLNVKKDKEVKNKAERSFNDCFLSFCSQQESESSDCVFSENDNLVQKQQEKKKITDSSSKERSRRRLQASNRTARSRKRLGKQFCKEKNTGPRPKRARGKRQSNTYYKYSFCCDTSESEENDSEYSNIDCMRKKCKDCDGNDDKDDIIKHDIEKKDVLFSVQKLESSQRNMCSFPVKFCRVVLTRISDLETHNSLLDPDKFCSKMCREAHLKTLY